MFFFWKGPTLYTVAQFLSGKETQHGKKGRKKLLCEVVFHWCVSIRILMRHVYINPVFSQFGTANLQSPAEPCAVGFLFLAPEVFCCFWNCSFKNKLLPVFLANCSFKNKLVFFLCNCSFGTRTFVYSFNCSLRTTSPCDNDISCLVCLPWTVTFQVRLCSFLIWTNIAVQFYLSSSCIFPALFTTLTVVFLYLQIVRSVPVKDLSAITVAYFVVNSKYIFFL